MSNFKCLLLIFYLKFLLPSSYGQNFEVEIPPLACPEHFQYVDLGGTLIGKLTLSKLELGTTNVEAYFSQYVPVESRYFGRLTILSEDETDAENLIIFRVDFPLIDVLPKLTRIVVNGKVICSAPGYSSPAISYKMRHTFQTTVRAIGTAMGSRIKSNFQPILLHNYKVNVQSRKDAEMNEYLKSICGQSGTESNFDKKFDGFIHGGEALKPGEYPWLAAIYKHRTSYLCGGSLISANTILTAAHCFDEPGLTADHITVYLGRFNLSDPMEKNFLLREINSLVIHPEYKSGNSFPDADLGLLQILEPVSFTQFIRPICLWSEPSDSSLIVGTSGIVAGWGLTDFKQTLSVVPKKVEQNVVSELDCLRSSPGFYSITSKRTLCAGGRDGAGPCGGDSGGGLIFYRNGRWVLRAVVSAGQTNKGHCDLGEYVVYCDIAQHIRWVLNSMLT